MRLSSAIRCCWLRKCAEYAGRDAVPYSDRQGLGPPRSQSPAPLRPGCWRWVTAKRSAGGGGRSLCARAAPGSRRWGAASAPPTPDNSARGGERAVPETFPRRLRRRRRRRRRRPRPGARPSLLAVGALGRRRRGGTEPREGDARRRCSRLPAAREAAPRSPARRRAPSRAMGEAPSPAPALWDWDYLDRCFARHRVCISFGLWICASSCWIAAHALLLYLRCAQKSRQDQSALCAACCLLTSLCDTVGAVLARQLTIQVFTGAYLAAIDLVNFMFILFPVCGSKFKSNSGREARERKRRRHLRASVFALALPLILGPCWALWVAVPKASATIRGPQRRLLASLLQGNTEIFGYLLGSIAAFGSWASRIPPLSRICRGKTFPSIHLWTRLLSALAGLLYASAIVAHDQQPEYLLRATPWFLTSLGRAALDLAIIFLSCVMTSKMRQALGFATEARESPDTQALLTCAEKEEENQEARNEDKNSDWVPLTTLSRCKSLRTMTAISRYMELTIEPVQQAGCSATRLPGDGQTSAGDVSLQEPPSYPPVQVIRARVSSGSSSEVSSVNSDLEQKYWEALNSEQWDPEDVNLEGSKENVELLGSQGHRDPVRTAHLSDDD
ncbi:transmembrane protein 44 isoform X3 [Nomascus leucogenys]|uniref:transmembrane protein 44 isoform X3 n=1 Tax=Nomascus leucogenys TaxID=61853 RepID=UPI00122DB847|nr:transmembrane protein 44 isoform X3 [Nomascus leucogenys]